jgi:hypothetical protein
VKTKKSYPIVLRMLLYRNCRIGVPAVGRLDFLSLATIAVPSVEKTSRSQRRRQAHAITDSHPR